jgi:hypothetical protein
MNYYLNDHRIIPEIIIYIEKIISEYYCNNNNILYDGLHISTSSNCPCQDINDSNNNIYKIKWYYFNKDTFHNIDKNIPLLHEISRNILNSVLNVIDNMIIKCNNIPNCNAFPELFHSLYEKLDVFNNSNINCNYSKDKITNIMSQLNDIMNNKKFNRLPLVWRKKDKVTPLTSYAPDYSEHFVIKKDATLSHEQAQVKQMKRQLKRENKAVIRELRRDAEFLSHETVRRQSEHTAKVKDARHKNYSWMEEQQATFNQQVRLGAKYIKGAGSAAVKEKIKMKRSSKR